MEIKFNGITPSWISDIISDNNLQNQSFSKYCSGIAPMIEEVKNII